MIILLILLLLLVFGGGGYWSYSSYPEQRGALGIIWTILLILVLLWAFGELGGHSLYIR